MDATTSAIIKEIADNLLPLQNLNNPSYSDPNFLGAMLASLVALLIAIYSEQFRNLARRTNLSVKNVRINEQGNGNSVYYRLEIINEGNYPAKNVEVYVDSIQENSQTRENFLPVPLRWTHARAYMSAGVYRDIHPNQSVLLDFCEFVKDRNLLHLSLAAGGENPEFAILHGGDMQVDIKIYQESGKTIKITLPISWDSGQNPVVSRAE